MPCYSVDTHTKISRLPPKTHNKKGIKLFSQKATKEFLTVLSTKEWRSNVSNALFLCHASGLQKNMFKMYTFC